MPSIDSRYLTVLGTPLTLAAGAIFSRFAMTPHLGLWAYVVFALAALGIVTLWRDSWALYYRILLRRRTPQAFEKVAQVHNPGIMNPALPGNPEFIKHEARVAVMNVQALMTKLALAPGPFDADDPVSVAEWHASLLPLSGRDY